MKRILPFLAALSFAAASAHAQSAITKVAVTSLVGERLTISSPRELVGTTIARNNTSVMEMPGPALDHVVLQVVENALKPALPGAQVALLRVPAAGTSADPVHFFADGLVDARNSVLQQLRQQGFSHVVAVLKLRDQNRVRLGDDSIGQGQLEGLGFYVDKRVEVQRRDQAAVYQGIVAPHVYLQLVLIDLAAGEVRGIQKVSASTTVSAEGSKTGDDPWNALTAEEKVAAIESLIRREVGPAVPRLVGRN